MFFLQSKTTADVGTLTEPECLAPCDAGTEVHLSGIIWHESESGKLPFHNGGSYRHYNTHIQYNSDKREINKTGASTGHASPNHPLFTTVRLYIKQTRTLFTDDMTHILIWGTFVLAFEDQTVLPHSLYRRLKGVVDVVLYSHLRWLPLTPLFHLILISHFCGDRTFVFFYDSNIASSGCQDFNLIMFA